MYEFIITAISSPLNLCPESEKVKVRFHLSVTAPDFETARGIFKRYMPGVQIEKISRL